MFQYYYLLSLLPTIFFKNKINYSSKSLIDLCQNKLSETKLCELKNLLLDPDINKTQIKFIIDWYNFETYLRNRLIEIRGKNSSLHLSTINIDNDLDKIISEIKIIQNPIQIEEILDNCRWNWLNIMDQKFLFKFENLCIYKLRILICEKWIARTYKDGSKNMNSLVNDKINIIST